MSIEFWLFLQWKLYGVLIVVYLLFRWCMSPYKFFEKKGIAFKKPWPVIGNFGGMTFRRTTIHDMIYESYMEFKGKK